MSKQKEKHMVHGIDLSIVCNRNEARVAACLRNMLDELGVTDLPDNVLLDAYAFAMNQLPARYVQTGSIVLRDPVREDDIQQVVMNALHHVLKNPKS